MPYVVLRHAVDEAAKAYGHFEGGRFDDGMHTLAAALSEVRSFARHLDGWFDGERAVRIDTLLETFEGGSPQSLSPHNLRRAGEALRVANRYVNDPAIAMNGGVVAYERMLADVRESLAAAASRP